MDLLRAKSDDKKVIFRKLFNTEMYQDIVTELGNRKRAKEKEIAVLKTQCQGEVSRIRIPETYESETLKQLKKQLEEGEMTRLTDLLEEVEKLGVEVMLNTVAYGFYPNDEGVALAVNGEKGMIGWKNILIWQKKIIGNRLKTETKKENYIPRRKHF